MSIAGIFIIINPSAGKDEPVEEIIERVFKDSEIKVTTHILTENEDPAAIAAAAVNLADMVAIYGGDGSVTQTAAALINSDKPLAIIPGGTANVLAKDLNIPQDTEEAIQMLKAGKYTLKIIDTGIVNDKPFLLRVNLGIMAEMITETDPELKDKIGQLAYGVATVKSLVNAKSVKYHIDIDDRTFDEEGVALTITNSGSAGIGDLQMVSGISVSDGLLDVVLLKDAGFLSLLKATGGILLGKETDALMHWQGKNMSVTLPDEQVYLCDDCEDKGTQLVIKNIPASLIVAVPITE